MANRSFNLSELNGTDGFVINGIDVADFAGASVSSAGDINGDTFADLIIGAPLADPNSDDSAGESYVVFGGPAVGSAGSVNLSELNGTNGFVINGIEARDLSGWSVSSAGDINNDGIADLLIGAWRAGPITNIDAGASYVVFGSPSVGSSGSLNLSDLNGSNGFVINGIADNDQSGFSVSAAGDINADGISDLIIGARQAHPGGITGAGESYVVFGGQNVGANGNLNIVFLNGNNGFRINGIALNDQSGTSVSDAGDVNGDGIADLIIGAPSANPNGVFHAGQSYVVFGSPTVGASRDFELSGLNGSNGFVINGIALNDQSGISVSGAGDINGDGFADLLIGARGAALNGSSSVGASYLVFGGQTVGASGNFNLADLNGSNGFVITGIDANDQSGISVSGAGDIDNDGFADLIIGASGASPDGNSSVGESYVVFGSATVGLSGSLNLSDLGNNGFVLNGIEANDQSGFSVSGAGDINGDGFADLVIGAPGLLNNSSSPSESYVLFGSIALGPGAVGPDFNNDGQRDILWRNGATGEYGVSLMDSTQFLSYEVLGVEPDLNWDIPSTGDLNSDGQTDILWRNGATGEYGVSLMDGTQFVSYEVLTVEPDLNWQIAA